MTTAYEQPRDWDRPEAPDRQALLVAGGVLEILAGAACLLLLSFTALGVAMAWRHGGASQLRASIPGLVAYVAVATILIWTGIGSMLARRWAYAVTVAGSVVWLVRGLGGLAVATATVPYMLKAWPETGGGAPAWAATVAAVSMVGTAAVGGVFAPAVLLVLYTRRGVRATCEARDRVPRWTDRCPLAVLILAAALVTEAATDVAAATAGGSNVLFGRVLTGSWATTVALLTAGAAALIALDVSWLRRWAWWASLVYLAACAVSACLGIFVDPRRVYEGMAYAEAWTASWGTFTGFMYRAQMTAAAVNAVAWLAYAVYLRRDFRADRAAAAEPDAFTP
jgi:hypothetical protein